MSIEIENAGPVESLSVPVEGNGGIVVIRGMNDAGKSESLKAIQKLLGGNEKITKRYGTAKGVVSGLGATLNVMSNVRASGECVAISLAGKLDIGGLIDPGLKDPVAADKARVRALLLVRGVTAEASLFHDLVGGKESFDLVASDGTIGATDIVDMSTRLKKDLEAAARKTADKAKTSEIESRVKRAVAEGLDMDAQDDAGELQTSLEYAIRSEGILEQSRADGNVATEKADAAIRSLSEAEASYTGPTVDQASDEDALVSKMAGVAGEKVDAIRQTLADAESVRVKLDAESSMVSAVLKGAKDHYAALSAWRNTVESATDVDGVADSDISAAADAVKTAREAVENGARIRDAKAALREADDAQSDADTLGAMATKLRDAAARTNDVLSQAIKVGCLVPVADYNGNFRLAVKSENGDRRRVYYHDLGPGRRTAIAAMEVASCLRDSGTSEIALVVLPQHHWEGLDWEQRIDVHQHVVGLGITLITAECDKDPSDTGGIRAETFAG